MLASVAETGEAGDDAGEKGLEDGAVARMEPRTIWGQRKNVYFDTISQKFGFALLFHGPPITLGWW